MVNFQDEDLSTSRFTRVRLSGSNLDNVYFNDAQFREVDLSGTRFNGVSFERAQIWGDIDGLIINSVLVSPLIDAELDRRYPEHAMLKPTTAQGYRDAWRQLQHTWQPTLARAAALSEQQQNAHIVGEWSVIQTVRHLSFAITSWLDRAILGDPSPWQPLDLPWDQMPPHPDVPWDTDTAVTWAQARGLYDASASRLSAYLGQLTDDELGQPAKLSSNPNWPDEHPEVAECLRVILNETFWHHRFAVRDLDQLDN